MKVALNRKPYYFTSENNRTLDIKDQAMINYIFSLPNNAEFEVIERESIEDDSTSEQFIKEDKSKVKKAYRKKIKGGKK